MNDDQETLDLLMKRIVTLVALKVFADLCRELIDEDPEPLRTAMHGELDARVQRAREALTA